MAAPSSSIVDLRKLLAERFPQVPLVTQGRLSTGIPALDEATGGGLAKGAITEVTAPHASCGSAAVIQSLVRLAHTERFFIALIDGSDSFDLEPLGNAVLRHLLWVRCRKSAEAVKAADLLLRDGNFPIVVLDLVLNPAEELRKIPQTSWYRLQRLAEPIPTAFLVLTRRSMISSAQWKLTLESRWTLRDVQQENCSSTRLRFRVRRVQGGIQQMSGSA
jgi:hypothetical protein